MKLRERVSVIQEKNPGLIIVLAIALFNIAFLALFSLIISFMNGMPYPESLFNCLAIMFDPGCISGVVDGKGEAVLCVVCFIIAAFGLIAFSGAIIGYISNLISSFIDNANNGRNKLNFSGHTVILNWNDHALEIINEYLLAGKKSIIVVITSQERELILKRISDTISQTLREKKIKNCLSVIVRQGNVFSSQLLLDSSLEKAKSIIILGECSNQGEISQNGNGSIIKTLMQVSDIISKYAYGSDQKVIVEVPDDWTQNIVNEILSSKNKIRTEIEAVPVNELFGNIFTQFAIMPNLSRAYRELFSNEGVEFYSKETEFTSETDFFLSFIKNHAHAIPLTCRILNGKRFAYYLCEEEKNLTIVCNELPVRHEISLSGTYKNAKSKIIILGHNNNLDNILTGILRYNNEWDRNNNAVKVLILDEKENFERHNYYHDYTFVEECIPVEVHERKEIAERLCDQLDESGVTILILSQPNCEENEKDLFALTNLVYLQSALDRKMKQKKRASDSVDIVVEVMEPKNHDIVQNYSRSNVVISNRYVSKLMMQLADKDALYDFYKDILTFDIDGKEGKELYLKRVTEYFETMPEKMRIRDFVYSLYLETLENKGKGEVAIGWIDGKDRMVFFGGDLTSQYLELDQACTLIVLSDH